MSAHLEVMLRFITLKILKDQVSADADGPARRAALRLKVDGQCDK